MRHACLADYTEYGIEENSFLAMRESGCSDPSIDVIERNGQHHIIDGHHRAAAASTTKVPVDIRVVTDVENHLSSYQTIEEIMR